MQDLRLLLDTMAHRARGGVRSRARLTGPIRVGRSLAPAVLVALGWAAGCGGRLGGSTEADGSLGAGHATDGGATLGSPNDASQDPDACVSCPTTVDGACTGPVGCPPDLDSPDFPTWVEERIQEGVVRAPTCIVQDSCPELEIVEFGEGVDCDLEVLYDVATRTRRAVTGTCDGSLVHPCVGADGCLSERCLPRVTNATSTEVPCPGAPYPVLVTGDGAPPK
jgi:hypothetical protein